MAFSDGRSLRVYSVVVLAALVVASGYASWRMIPGSSRFRAAAAGNGVELSASMELAFAQWLGCLPVVIAALCLAKEPFARPQWAAPLNAGCLVIVMGVFLFWRTLGVQALLSAVQNAP